MHSQSLKPEKVQKPNIYELPINQHVFPVKSISRFCNENGMLNTFRKINNEIINTIKPNNKIFCVERRWDKNAEHGYMKCIEDKFQSLADRLLMNNSKVVSPLDYLTITEMFALWLFRASAKYELREDIELNIEADQILTKDQEEKLESLGFIYCRGNKVQSHIAMGSKIHVSLMSFMNQYKHLHWDIYDLEHLNLEVIVPDNPLPHMAYLPLTPTKILLPCQSQPICANDINRLNINSVANSKEYFFAKNLNKCIII